MIKYTVQSGDTLYKLSKGLNCSVDDICRANSITASQILREGQILHIPAQTAGSMPSDCPNSTNTTRACGCNFFETEVSTSRLVFFSERPRAVYLARSDVFGEAVAASALQHFPINGPLLLTDPNRLPDIAAAEIRRLNPAGAPGSAQVVVIEA